MWPTRTSGARRARRSHPAALPDPDVLYTETIKNALIDAMLDYSMAAMDLGDRRVADGAARDAKARCHRPETTIATIIMRVKGSDLAIFPAQDAHAG